MYGRNSKGIVGIHQRNLDCMFLVFKSYEDLELKKLTLLNEDSIFITAERNESEFSNAMLKQ